MPNKRYEDVECGHCHNIFPVIFPKVDPKDNTFTRVEAKGVLGLIRGNNRVYCPYCKTVFYHEKGQWIGKVIVELKKAR